MSTTWPKGTCNSCHQPVIWAFTEKNKRMPVDPIPTERGTIALSGPMPRANVMSKRGRTSGQLLYVVHFDECPGANKHRKGAQPARPVPQPTGQGDLFGGGR